MRTLFRPPLLLSLLGLALLSACGGGGGGGASPASSPKTGSQVLVGQVIDGYLEGATVCLDLDHSGSCDAGEPSASTGDHGRYALQFDGTVPGDAHLLVEVSPTTRDSDHGGLTLAEAGYQGYTLAAPIGRPTHITPLSTMVVGKLKSGSARSVREAEEAVIQDLQLPAGTDLGQSPLEHPELRAKARRIARQLQSDAALTATERWIQVSGRLRDYALFGPLFGDLLHSSSPPPSAAARLAAAGTPAQSQLLTYAMPRTRDGQTTKATALLLTPLQAPPAQGWPLVVLAVSATDVASACAASLGQLDALHLQWVHQLLTSNMAVVIADLEGRGPSNPQATDSHPWLNLRSAGRAMALAALASRHHLGSRLSGQWAALGQAQGGHAALAAAQFSGLATDMQYRGAVALAPHAGFMARIDKVLSAAAQAHYGHTHDVYVALAQIGSLVTAMIQGSAATETPLDAAALLRTGLPEAPRMPQVLGLREIHDRTRPLCQDALPRLVSEDVTHYAFRNFGPIDYPGLQAQALAAAPVTAYFSANEPGAVKLPGRTLLLQGQSDTTVHPASTELLLERMQRLGSQVSLTRYGGLGHQDLAADPRATAEWLGFLGTLWSR